MLSQDQEGWTLTPLVNMATPYRGIRITGICAQTIQDHPLRVCPVTLGASGVGLVRTRRVPLHVRSDCSQLEGVAHMTRQGASGVVGVDHAVAVGMKSNNLMTRDSTLP